MHECPVCGLAHEAPELDAAAEPVVVESGPNANDVAIAEIEAAASIEREKIWTEQRGADLELEVERLRGELAGVRETLAMVSPPEPDPAAAEPVVVPMPEPEPAAAAEPAGAPPVAEPAAAASSSSKRKSGWF